MRRIFRFAALMLCASMVLSLAACQNNQPTSVFQSNAGVERTQKDATVNPDNLYGMCFLQEFWESKNHAEYDCADSVAIMKNLGVRVWRNWMHLPWLLDAPDLINPDAAARFHQSTQAAQKQGIEVIGMSHFWFTERANEVFAVPDRDLTAGSEYMRFLDSYRLSWETMVREFPEITLWEIGNEINNDAFVHPFDWATTGRVFDFEQKALIAVDMSYYASLGVHTANPAATTILGGLASPNAFYNGKNENFLERMYQLIGSGVWPSTDPDDFFEALAWHPYTTTQTSEKKPAMDWVQVNLDLYAIAQKYEKKAKKVYLTEVGWYDTATLNEKDFEADLDRNIAYMQEMYRLTAEYLPFVESICYFRLYNDYSEWTWQKARWVTSFGLLHDPVYEDGLPKSIAYAYQAMAGGQGDLTLSRNRFPEPNPYF